MNFIPAQESDFFRRVFRIFVKWFFKIKFSNILIHQEYIPSGNDRTVYFLNHTSWWDGLIPFLLNEYRFNQKGRAMMEYKQMRTYPFFKKLGAFSSMPHNRSHTLSSLRYAVQSMQRKNASLYIYPQGKIVPAGTAMDFKRGVSWLQKQLPGVHFVPIAINIHTIRHHKPELHLWVGHPIQPSPAKNLSEQTAVFEEKIEEILAKMRKTAGFDDQPYESFF